MHQARSRGIRVIIDLVVNHTSDRHPWFQERARDRDRRYRDWYVWSKKRPPDWHERHGLPRRPEGDLDVATARRGEYYFHRFYDFQPDLNMDNPRVREEIRRIMGFWLQLGVAGFRVDAVPFIIEKPPRAGAKPHDALRVPDGASASFLQWRVGDAVLLGEANVAARRDAARTSRDGDGLHMMFNFWVNQHLFYALATGDARPLAQALRATRELPRDGAVGALPAQPRRARSRPADGAAAASACSSAFGPTPAMQLYGRGIRRRLAPMLGDRRRLELAYSLLLLAARARRCSATATRSAWATTSACPSATPSARRCSGRRERNGGFSTARAARPARRRARRRTATSA